MASMNFTSFSISKASIPPQPSLSFPQKASRVCFTSASKHSQRIYASEGANYVTGKSLSEMGGDAKDKLKEGQQAAGEVKDGSLADLKEATEKMKDNVAEMKDKVSNMAGKSSEQVGGIAKEATDKIGEDANTVVEVVTSAKDQAIDAVGSVAEKTQKAAEGAWDAAKGAFAKE